MSTPSAPGQPNPDQPQPFWQQPQPQPAQPQWHQPQPAQQHWQQPQQGGPQWRPQSDGAFNILGLVALLLLALSALGALAAPFLYRFGVEGMGTIAFQLPTIYHGVLEFTALGLAIGGVASKRASRGRALAYIALGGAALGLIGLLLGQLGGWLATLAY